MNGANWEPEARRWGMPLVAQNGRWKLEHPERQWEQQSLASALGLQGKKGIAIWPLCDSSNTRLLEDSRLRLGLAEAQWSGHGRRGRVWHSSFGKHLYCSLAVEISADHASVLPLIAGLGIHQVLHKHVPTLWLKWPNDLWVGKQKLAGLMLEGRHGVGGQRWVLGCGINVLADSGLPPEATSLVGAGYATSRQELLIVILQQWQEDFARLRKDGFAAFRQRWQQADRLRGNWVELEMEGETSSWQVLDMQDDGGLRINNGTRQKTIHAGEVRLRPRP